MFLFDVFRIEETLNVGRRGSVFRATHVDTGTTVIIKTFSVSTQLGKFRREYQIAQRMKGCEHVGQVDKLVERYQVMGVHTVAAAMIMKDSHSQSITRYMPCASLDLFLDIAVQITMGLSEIHREGVIHQDLKPDNILMRDDGTVEIIDFSSASTLREQHVSFTRFEGTLGYISPEQTGRFNLTVDYRTDLYSLGVTLYQILCGSLPFKTNDARELIYCHLAVDPVSPYNLTNGKVPLVISNIIMKLLRKNPDDRYQSTSGVIHDLRACLDQIKNNGTIQFFEIARFDTSERFVISNRLYGRSSEIQILMNLFNRVKSGPAEIVVVSGFSGLGKSSLINEIRKPVTNDQGVFLIGKFDQHNRDNAYFVFRTAFVELVNYILESEDYQIQDWKNSILKALGTNTKILLDIIPEFESLLGSQAALEVLGSVETKNRFRVTLQTFISVVTKKISMVLFLDDLQWANVACLGLVQMILETPDLSRFLFIGSYRSNEVDENHPAVITINSLKDAGIPASSIPLDPITFDEVVQWISDTMHSSTDKVLALAEYIWSRCSGNPWSIRMYLQTLYNQNMIFRTSDSAWSYDISTAMLPAAEYVVDSMLSQMRDISGATVDLLKKCACLGNAFALDKIQMITGYSIEDLWTDLAPALNLGLIIASADTIHFAHDRVQEAAYKLLTDDEKEKIHLLVATTILENCGEDNAALEEHVIEIADHLNRCKSYTDISYRQRADLNLLAGRKCKAAVAYSSAINYFQNGIEAFNQILGDEKQSWVELNDLGFLLHKDLADVYYSNGQHEESDSCIRILLANADNILKKSAVYTMKITQLTVATKLAEAVETGLTALEQFNIQLPTAPNLILQELISEQVQVQSTLKQRLEGCSNNDFSDFVTSIQLATDPEKLAVNEIFSTMAVPLTLSNPLLFALVVSKSVNLCLNYGMTTTSPKSFVYFGLLLVDSPNVADRPMAMSMAKIALDLCEKLAPKDLAQKCIVNHLFSCQIIPWFRKLKEAQPYSDDAFKFGFESGELQFCGYSRYILIQMFMRGEPIDFIVSEITKALLFLRKLSNQMAVKTIRSLQLQLFFLLGRRHEQKEQELKELQETELEELRKSNMAFLYAHYRVLQTIRMVIEDKSLEETMEVCEDASNYTSAMQALVIGPVFQFYKAVLISRVLSSNLTISEEKRSVLLSEFSDITSTIQVLSAQNPATFQHKLLVLEAEKLRLDDNWEACDLYDQAITLATEQEMLHEVAVINELASKFWYAKGKIKIAKMYMKSAYGAYRDWGAIGKLEILHKKYSDLLPTKLYVSPTVGSISSNTANISLAMMDLETVVKASQIISSTLDLNKLLRVLMSLIIEAAGATFGAIIIDGTIEATYNSNLEEKIDTLCSIPLDTCDKLCKTIVESVVRTKEVVCLKNASEQGAFVTNRYILQNGTKSILCMPVKQENELRAVLYLENNLTTNAFTVQRVQVLQMLTSQIAISLENANYFDAQIKAAEEIAHIQQKRAEEQEWFRRKQEDFVDRVCHEIRNPLHGILGTVDYVQDSLEKLRSQLTSVDSARQLNNVVSGLKTIEICARHQQGITDDVITLSKLEAKEVGLNLHPFDPNELITGVCNMFKSEITSKSLTLNVDLLPQSKMLMGDSVKVSQVLINLLSNAIKYSFENSVIDISCQIHTDLSSDGVLLKICVRDVGEGLAESDKHAIFDRFKQATKHHSQYNEGSGLGLFICKNLCDVMGGSISVTSQSGDTKFSFQVPCTVAGHHPPQTSNESDQKRPVVTNLHVLIAEDNKINQRVLVRMLEPRGYTCLIANDGEEAVNLYMQFHNQIDLCLFDIEMPRKTGLEATEAIRQYEKENNIKRRLIIGVSGNARDAHIRVAIESGMDDYLTKPLNPSQLLACVDKHLGG